jgi:peptidoglycan hydrolase CwlO-like protein
MQHNEILARVEQKITQLGDAKRELETQAVRLREENASLYRINKELLAQVNELTEKSKELENTQALKVTAREEDFRTDTRQRINALVNEIDDCIALLNK